MMHGSRDPFLQFAHAGRLLVFGLILVFALAACSSSDDEDDGPLFDPGPLPDATEFVAGIEIEGGDAAYVNAEFPAGTSSIAPTVLGSNQFISGAVLGLLITPSPTATQLIIGVRGSGNGYWSYDLAGVPKRGTEVWYGGEAGEKSAKAGMPKLTRFESSKAPEGSYLVMVTPASDTGFTLYISESDGETISRPVRHSAYANVDASASDLLQVSLNFIHHIDMDLHLETPEFETIYWANRVGSTGGELDLDSNAGCGIDGVNNENITWVNGNTPSMGTYTVRVDLWSECNQPGPFPYLVTTIVNGQAQIYFGEFSQQEVQAGGAIHDITTITLSPPAN